MCILKVHIRDGKIWAIEPDDTVNKGIAREDGHLSDADIDKCMYTTRPCTKGYAHIRNLLRPEPRDLPDETCGERGSVSGSGYPGTRRSIPSLPS